MKNFLILLSISALLYSCSSNETTGTFPPDSEITDPLDSIISTLQNDNVFEIVLKESNYNHQHKYQIITEKDTTDPLTNEKFITPAFNETPWLYVTTSFYNKNINNTGMTIASKDSTGVITKVESPPGYSRYVGHHHYGYWSRGLWCFLPRYGSLNSRFNTTSNPIYRADYHDYKTNYQNKKSYYGTTSTGTPKYGSQSMGAKNKINSGSRLGGGSFRSSGGGFGK